MTVTKSLWRRDDASRRTPATMIANDPALRVGDSRSPPRLRASWRSHADYAPSAREAEWVEAAFAAPATLTDRRPAAPTIVD